MKTYLQKRNSGDVFDVLEDFFKPMFYDEQLDSMRTDIKETDKDYRLSIEMPGFKKDEIKVSLENGYLTVSAEKQEKEEEGGKDEKYLRRECRVSCQRSYYVGEQVQEESVKAKYENGVLTITATESGTYSVQTKIFSSPAVPAALPEELPQPVRRPAASVSVSAEQIHLFFIILPPFSSFSLSFLLLKDHSESEPPVQSYPAESEWKVRSHPAPRRS